jgi:hypothetical protein
MRVLCFYLVPGYASQQTVSYGHMSQMETQSHTGTSLNSQSVGNRLDIAWAWGDPDHQESILALDPIETFTVEEGSKSAE